MVSWRLEVRLLSGSRLDSADPLHMTSQGPNSALTEVKGIPIIGWDLSASIVWPQCKGSIGSGKYSGVHSWIIPLNRWNVKNTHAHFYSWQDCSCWWGPTEHSGSPMDCLCPTERYFAPRTCSTFEMIPYEAAILFGLQPNNRVEAGSECTITLSERIEKYTFQYYHDN